MFLSRRNLFQASAALVAAVLLSQTPAPAGELPNVHVYPALEKQAIAYIAGSPYRMKVSETCSNSGSVYVIAYRDQLPGTRTFRFDVRLNGRRVELVTPPTNVK